MSTITNSPEWNALEQHFNAIKHVEMQALFNGNPNRFNEYSLQLNDLLFDFSKNRITSETLPLLIDLA
jgi:glucose-6-phosphate isomerase